LATYKDAFDAYDLNGDGVVDMEELQLGFEKTGGRSRKRSSVLSLVHSVKDTPKEESSKETLSFDDFVNLMRSKELEDFFEKGPTYANIDDKTTSLESIYGQTPTPEETPTLIEEKMKELDNEMKTMPERNKKGYKEAKEKCPDLVDDHDFKLMFLRCEVFNVLPAAERLALYWDKRIEVFGPEKAFLPLTIEGALKDDDVALSIGHQQLTGHKDKDGRRIAFFDFTVEDSSKYERSSLLRAFWYFIHVTLEDTETQKRGAVCMMRTVTRLSQWDARASTMIAHAARGVLPIRVAAMHVCHPKPIINVIAKVTKVFLGPKLRKRFYVHKGSNEDVLEKLAAYGISHEAVPTFWGGKLILDHQKWLDDRRGA